MIDIEARIEGRKIIPEWMELGVREDHKVEKVRFILPRYTGTGVDLSQGICYLCYERPDKSVGYTVIEESEKEVGDETLTVVWKVEESVTSQPGTLMLALKISGLEGELWHSEAAYCTVSPTIEAASEGLMPEPGDTAGEGEGEVTIPAQHREPPITVAERTLNIPLQRQNIAVQNDQNSETVLIRCPRYYGGQDLSQYQFWLRTVNSEGMYDAVALTPQIGECELTMEWTLRPPQTSYSGRLTVQLWVTGEDFDWQTQEATVHIVRQIGGDPVIPVTPPVLDEFLQQISAIQNVVRDYSESARESEAAASDSASKAQEQAQSAKESANAAAASAESAKKSETAAAGSLTDIEAGLAGKLSVAQAGPLIREVELEEKNGTFTFIRYDGTSFQIDTALEKAVINFRYDPESNALVLELEDGSQQRIDMTAFTNIYTGGETSTAAVTVKGSQITAAVKGGSIGQNHLAQQLQDTIAGKLTAHESGNASQVLFSDGESMQEKLDSGAFNGKDGVSVTLSGLFYMRVDEFGHLKVGVADGADPPPLAIREGHLIYTIV